MTETATHTPQTEEAEEGVLKRAIETLHDLTVALRSATNKEQRTDAWASVQDAQVVTLVAQAYQENSTKIEQHLSILGTFVGSATRANQFAKAVVRMARTLTAQGRADSMLSSLGAVATVLDRCPPERLIPTEVLAQLKVPRGWMLNDEGVFKLNQEEDPSHICLAPLFLVGRTQDVLTGESHRTICWKGSTGWCQRIVPRGMLSEARKLTALAEFEAPVHSNNAATLVSYLADYEAENSLNMPLVHSTSKLGWMRDGSFVFPEQRIAPPGVKPASFTLTPPEGFENVAKGIQISGTWEGWLEIAEIARDWPYLMVGIYAALAAPLLHVLKHPSFVIDFNGETTGGKTTTLRVAASTMGIPKTGGSSAMHSWDMTKVWLEQTAGFMGNLPVILDDTKRAKSSRVIRDVIYDFSFGGGRGRGAKTGGTRRTSSWSSVLLSSGESSITSFSQDGGTRARVLEFRGKPMGLDPKHGAELSELIQVLVARHHGHMMRRFIEYLAANREHWDQIREAFEQSKMKHAGNLHTPVARRHAGNLAALEIAAEIAHSIGLPRPRADVYSHILKSARMQGISADRPLNAMIAVVNWCSANSTHFWGRHQTDGKGVMRVPSGGFAGSWEGAGWTYIGIRSRKLREILKDEGHHPPEILDRWIERGWMEEKDRTPRGPTGGRLRCKAITRKGVAVALGQQNLQHEDEESEGGEGASLDTGEQ